MRQTRLPAAGRARRRFATIGAGVLAVALVPTLAFGAHGLATLEGSNFEIDEDANLKVDHTSPPSLDWANVTEIRATDAVNGTGDNSYAGGVKENTVCPGETTDSIPPNKSDLLSFHVYEEAGEGAHPGFLNLAWSRVSEPTGTTLMDFEFNQSETACDSGPNVIRTEGDLLIEYAIDQGGARADITARFWTGSEWGPTTDLDADSTTCPDSNNDPAPCAAGTINSSPIPAADSDGLITTGEKQARTFGEAQIDLRLIFAPEECSSFGSAMLKSRSSDAFNSQLKDFVAPVPIELQNCGQVIIRKETVPDEDPNTTEFGYTKAFPTDPSNGNTFTLKDDGVKDFGKTVLFGTGYTVTEDVIPANWELQSLDCSASSVGTSYVVNGATVTFDIDADTDKLDCTYTNKLNLGAIEITKTRKHAAAGSGDKPHPGVKFTIAADGETTGQEVTTDANGVACLDGLPFGSAGTEYDVIETVPTGYVGEGGSTTTVKKDVTVNATSTCGDGNEAEVTFHNTPLTDITVSVDSQVDGGTSSTIKCTDADGNVSNGSTGANGDGSLTVNDLLPTDQTTTPPTITLTCEVYVDP